MRSFLKTLDRYAMLRQGDAVLAALSGGADSVALLHLLSALRSEMAITLYAAHMNHGLRGDESMRDEQFCRELCERYAIPFFVRQADVKLEAARAKEGIESCGRRLRYLFFHEIADELGAKIATAHTLSDQVETVLMKLVRGAGIQGLCGIPPVRGRIIRPLIGSTRAEVLEYCTRHALSYVIDSSNFSRDYRRNVLRMDVIPLLTEMNPSLPFAVERMTQSLCEDRDYLETAAQEALSACEHPDGSYDAHKMAELPISLRTRAVRLIAQRAGSEMDAVHVRLALEILEKGGAVELPGGIRFCVQRGTVLSVAGTVQENPPILRSCFIDFKKDVLFGCYKMKFTPINLQENKNVHKKLFNNLVDCDKIIGNVVLRTKIPGDFFHPAGRGCGKTLKKLFIEQGVERALRTQIPVLSDDEGILWVAGFGCDARVFPNEFTKNAVLVETLGGESSQ